MARNISAGLNPFEFRASFDRSPCSNGGSSPKVLIPLNSGLHLIQRNPLLRAKAVVLIPLNSGLHLIV